MFLLGSEGVGMPSFRRRRSGDTGDSTWCIFRLRLGRQNRGDAVRGWNDCGWGVFRDPRHTWELDCWIEVRWIPLWNYGPIRRSI